MEKPSLFTRAKLAALAEAFCAHRYVRHSPEIVAVKSPFFGPPANFGSGDWPHCAATVRWLCNQLGVDMPVLCPAGIGYSFAFVPAMHRWSKQAGFFHANDGVFKPEPGDIVFYDWDGDHSDDHVGVHLRMNGSLFQAAEGNVDGGCTGIKNRGSSVILGWCRLPDGFHF